MINFFNTHNSNITKIIAHRYQIRDTHGSLIFEN